MNVIIKIGDISSFKFIEWNHEGYDSRSTRSHCSLLKYILIVCNPIMLCQNVYNKIVCFQ